ncbi:hypothetical protein AGMMS50256_38590 [Betaproteobacteria bacterium]|nr:hypothetical protein AGMMS50256_38590 [Betaproteobacteria bacterium]
MSAQFRAHIQASTGMITPEHIDPGKLYRFLGVGKANGNTAGWCKLFEDGLGGVHGDFASGFSDSWQANRETPYSQAEREAFKRQIEAARREREASDAKHRAEARENAAEIWAEALPCTDHDYLTIKGTAGKR